MNLMAFQVEVTSESGGRRQVFFVAGESGEDALARLAGHAGLLPAPKLKLQRRLSDAEVDMYNLGPDSVVQYR